MIQATNFCAPMIKLKSSFHTTTLSLRINSQKCMNWKIWSDEVRDSKLQLFQHLENSANCFDSMKQQSLEAFFIMIQDESRPAMNIKVEVWYINFPKCQRTTIDFTWARSYGLINKACCNFVQNRFGHITCLTWFLQALSSTKTSKNHWDYIISSTFEPKVKSSIHWHVKIIIAKVRT